MASTLTPVASDPAATTGAAPAPRPRRRRPERWAAAAFLAPLVVYLVLFYAYPLYRNLELSLRNYTVASFVRGGAPFVGLDNYASVLKDPVFVQALWHTAAFTLGSLAVQFTLGMALAVFFHHSFRLSGVLRALFLVPWLLPLIVSSSTWAWMLNGQSGVVNAALGAVGLPEPQWLSSPTWSLVAVLIANIWIGVPFNLVLLHSGLQAISSDVDEAAALDGATGWQRFRYITFPLLRPVSAITLLLGLVYTLKVFDIIWIMTRGGPSNSSTTLATWSYQLSFGGLVPKFGPGAAVGNLLIVVAFLAGLVYLRYQRKAEQ
jgi:multiple sugar transport system permease protein